jgi:shikimate kinase
VAIEEFQESAMNIYLFGMIGSGKSTVGATLAERLHWNFDDLDAAIDRRAGKSWRSVVAEDGWLVFRQYEYDICKDWSQKYHLVIGLGGGTVRYQWNRDVLTGTGLRIHLTARLHNLAERLRKCDRPRVNQGTTMEQDIVAIWRAHRHLYYSFADYTIRTDLGQTPEQVANEIQALIKLKYSQELTYCQ